ncbi:MAG TPA: DNA repair protein RecN, partial [Thermoanaerobaculia bacterium]|nr:DNA repair protein RecN [Thermoanaerobaculia bacterium]
LALLSGVRATADLIRTGAEVLTVSGVFSLPEGGAALRLVRGVLAEAGIELEAEEEVLVRREIARSGRNRVFVNDQPATLRLLAELAPHLLRIHGQREEMGLVDPELQRVWLDKSGGPEAERLTGEVAAAFAEHARLAARLEREAGGERVRRERIDLLRFELAEIDAAHLVAGEEVSLRAEREVLRHAEAITRALGTAFALLSEEEGAAVERLARSRSLLAEVEAWEPGAAEWGAELEELRIRAAEVAQSLSRRLDALEADPARLDAVEERLALVERLCRKYGGGTPAPPGTAEVLARRAERAAELDDLLGDGEDRSELAARVAEALARYRQAALALSAGRAAWGEALVGRIGAELKELGLGKARLAVGLERRRRADSPLELAGERIDFGPAGVDQVVFLFAANPGEEPRPLARIASGGELSRIYLALQLAARGEGESATLVFDEVDAGVGGAEAAALGKKLQRLARGGQILAVTHLPQVASHADVHFKVGKRVREGRTQVEVELLSPAARVEEVARMLAGREVTALSLSHAEELIASAARPANPARGRR